MPELEVNPREICLNALFYTLMDLVGLKLGIVEVTNQQSRADTHDKNHSNYTKPPEQTFFKQFGKTDQPFDQFNTVGTFKF